jgi:hypothetical protein
MFMPAVMPEAGWPPVGTYGFKDLTKAQQNLCKEETNAKPRTATTIGTIRVSKSFFLLSCATSAIFSYIHHLFTD